MEGRRVVLDFRQREREREENFILFHSLDKKGQSEEGFVVTRFISFRIFNFYWIRL